MESALRKNFLGQEVNGKNNLKASSLRTSWAETGDLQAGVISVSRAPHTCRLPTNPRIPPFAQAHSDSLSPRPHRPAQPRVSPLHQ